MISEVSDSQWAIRKLADRTDDISGLMAVQVIAGRKCLPESRCETPLCRHPEAHDPC